MSNVLLLLHLNSETQNDNLRDSIAISNQKREVRNPFKSQKCLWSWSWRFSQHKPGHIDAILGSIINNNPQQGHFGIAMLKDSSTPIPDNEPKMMQK